MFALAGEGGVKDTADIGGRDAQAIVDEVDRTITPCETSVMSSREASACHALSANVESADLSALASIPRLCGYT
ncbi:hypothetical protein [Novosphingobium sp. P6W]|uniref:hypothetical protein n=1 Tax=Novosphingobium sp. P6W TaxID=1609758 RepID=UPI0005C6C7FE|nr:hypothetical protein [Novosphingobium sp. P6W]AXB78780.1 hypothetical protein TQ38_019480 [Novosphingobium sp. P6W]